MTLVFKINTGLFYFKASCSVCLRGQSVESSATGRCYSLCRICRVVNKATCSSNLPTLSLLLRHGSRKSWRSFCCRNSRAMSSGDWRCCRRRRGNYRPRGRTNRLCWTNWWDAHVAWPCACVMTNLVMQLASHIMTDVPCRMCMRSALGFVDVRSLRAYYQSLCCRLHCSHSVIPKPIGSIVLSCRLWKLLFRQSGLLKDHHR